MKNTRSKILIILLIGAVLIYGMGLPFGVYGQGYNPPPGTFNLGGGASTQIQSQYGTVSNPTQPDAGSGLPAAATPSGGSTAGGSAGGGVASNVVNCITQAAAGAGSIAASALTLTLSGTVFDAANLTAKCFDAALSIANWAKQDLAVGLRDIIAKRIIDYIVDQTIVWVQGGGQPKFVTDWNGFLRDAGNIAFDQVIKDVGLARICSPFANQLRLSLVPVQRFPQQISCTLDRVVKNIDNFYNDFSQGGWLAYNTLWQPNNNYYGLQLMIADKILLDTARETEAARSEAIAGGGFLSVRKCVEPEYTTREETVILGCKKYDTDGPGGTCLSYDTTTKYEQVEIGCKKYEINTPGSIVGAAVAKAVTSDTEWAANIQSWTSGLIRAAIYRLTKEGVGALRTAIVGESAANRSFSTGVSSFNSQSLYKPAELPSSGSAGTSGLGTTGFYPGEYQGLANQEFQTQKQTALANLQQSLNENRVVWDGKVKAMSASQQLVFVLGNIKSKSCPVSVSELQSAKSEADRLGSEVSVLDRNLSELKDIIFRLNQAPSIFQPGIYADYIRISNKYNTQGFQLQIVNGSVRKAASDEAAAKQKLLDEAQGRLNQCKQ